ncbi:triose-phosphate isomerase [Candidatus Woesearchaeota archaeon]|nr:triose-phosphate isomerase [Candidatus Woesearchaeota archaeon]
MKHLLLINFKNYPEATGSNAVKLAAALAKVKTDIYEIAIAPALLDLKEVCKNTKLAVYAQHADPVSHGASTGQVSLAELKKIGVKGTILNHSERKLPFSRIKKTVSMCIAHGLKTVICASTMRDIKDFAKVAPDYLAYEPSELIGGEVSVTTAKPKLLLKAVRLTHKKSPGTKLLCGAGVHSREDVQRALQLGCDGVLIAHAIARAKNPRQVLEKIL